MDTMTDLFDRAGVDAPAAAGGKRAKAKATGRKAKATTGKAAASGKAEPTAVESPRGRRGGGYSAKDIEVLEGLEPVRRRPGMYIGGTDERALHHLAAELLDNAMDEAVAGHASRIEIALAEDQTVTVSDNGRGIPVDPHPKFRDKSALEVILTTLHSGGKFGGDAYATSGGLHGALLGQLALGLAALEGHRPQSPVARHFHREFVRQRVDHRQPDAVQNRRGTTVAFHPDPKIFGARAHFRPVTLYRMARSKAYLFRGVEIRWSCDAKLLAADDDTPETAVLHFPGGLVDFLNTTLAERKTMTAEPFAGEARFNGDEAAGKAEWAVAWPVDEEDFFNSYCNTIPTPQGGTHEAGLRLALTRGLKAYGELINDKRAAKITADDVLGCATIMLSVFIPDPQFQGQTKEKLATVEAQKLVEASMRDHFDHWLTAAPDTAKALLQHVVERAETRLRKRQDRETKRQSATRRLRLPGKLADCSSTTKEGTELFIVEGDSAGGSAKQARDRETQAVLPLRGKILNVASATQDKLRQNQELQDLIEALGCGRGDAFMEDDLRYDKVVIMTDADVDGAHIASLLMTFFFREMAGLVETGHLYLAMPPLYRLSQGGKTIYARDDAHKDELLAKEFDGRGRVEISRFKGLGEMPPKQLRETTMDPANRTLLRITVPGHHTDDDRLEGKETARLVDSLMGKKPELRFRFIQEHARFVDDIDV